MTLGFSDLSGSQARALFEHQLAGSSWMRKERPSLAHYLWLKGIESSALGVNKKWQCSVKFPSFWAQALQAKILIFQGSVECQS